MLTVSKKRKACVVGGSVYVASMLVKLSLERGYSVNTTVRDPGSEKSLVPNLVSLTEHNIHQN